MKRKEILEKYKKDKDLRNADLWNANLSDADLWNANLSDADLWNANLRNADLRNAKNISPLYKSNLEILKHQTSKTIALKYLNKNMESPYQHHKYETGKTYKTKNYNSNECELCGEGLNVATLVWCLRDTNENIEDYVYIKVEFAVKDIVAIPYHSDGKFRVKKLKVLRKLTKKQLQKALKPLYPSKKQ